MTNAKLPLSNPNAPYRKAVAVTLDADFARGPADAIAVGGAGAIAAIWPDDSAVLITVPAGIHRLAIKRVNTTSTTATGLTALYLND